MKVGQESYFDVTQDGLSDVSVRLKFIEQEKAVLEIVVLSKQSGEKSEERKQEEKKEGDTKKSIEKTEEKTKEKCIIEKPVLELNKNIATAIIKGSKECEGKEVAIKLKGDINMWFDEDKKTINKKFEKTDGKIEIRENFELDKLDLSGTSKYYVEIDCNVCEIKEKESERITYFKAKEEIKTEEKIEEKQTKEVCEYISDIIESKTETSSGIKLVLSVEGNKECEGKEAKFTLKKIRSDGSLGVSGENKAVFSLSGEKILANADFGYKAGRAY